MPPCLGLLDRLMVVSVQQVKRRRIGIDHIQHLLDVKTVGNPLHHLNRLPELTHPLAVDGIATYDVVPEY